MATAELEFALAAPEPVRVCPLAPEDGPALQALYERLPDLLDLAGESGPADAVGTYMALPEGKGYEDKFLLGVWRDAALIGAIDCIRDHPARSAT